MKKISTMAKRGNEIFKEPKLTIGLDLGDRTSHYCILDEAGIGAFGDNELVSTSPRQLWNSARPRRKVLVMKLCCAFGVIPLARLCSSRVARCVRTRNIVAPKLTPK